MATAGSPPARASDLEAAWTSSTTVTLPKQDLPNSTAHNSSDIPTGPTKLKLQLATNMPSGYGTALDWSNPLLPSNNIHHHQQQHRHDAAEGVAAAVAGDGSGTTTAAAAAGGGGLRWRSSGFSVPISALQKCIRRGRAASATR